MALTTLGSFRCCRAAALLVAAALPGWAQAPRQTPSALPPFTRSVDVTVTNVDVVVLDGKGNRVSGLRKEDFEVSEDGIPQPVTNFYAVEGGRVTFFGDEAVAAPAPVPGQPAAAAAAEVPFPLPKTRIVIFIDNLHLTPFNRNRILKNVQDFVRTSVKGDVEAMIITYEKGLHVRRKFTNDARDLADVLKQMEEISGLGLQDISEKREIIQYIDEAQSEDMAIQRVRQYAQSVNNDLQFTFDAMRTVLNQLAGVDGRKILLHVSEGLPQSPGAELWRYVQDHFHSMSGLHNSFEFDKTASYGGLVQAANAAGVTIYTIDAGGLSVDTSFSAENKTQKERMDTFTEKNNLQSMLVLLAEETGGTAILNRNDVTLPLKELEKDYTSYYSLGYRSLRGGADRPHKLDVKVKRKGLVVKARRSYMEKGVETKVTESVVSALYFPRDDNPLSVGIEVGQAVPASDKQNFVVPIRVRIPFSRLTLLPEGTKLRGRVALYFVVLDVSGNQSDMAKQNQPIELEGKTEASLAKKDFLYEARLLMVPGGQRLSVAVRDEVTNTISYVQKSVFVSVLGSETKKG